MGTEKVYDVDGITAGDEENNKRMVTEKVLRADNLRGWGIQAHGNIRRYGGRLKGGGGGRAPALTA